MIHLQKLNYLIDLGYFLFLAISETIGCFYLKLSMVRYKITYSMFINNYQAKDKKGNSNKKVHRRVITEVE